MPWVPVSKTLEYHRLSWMGVDVSRFLKNSRGSISFTSMWYISQKKKKKKKLRLRFTGMFLLFCLFLHVLNATASGPWCEAGPRDRLGSVSPLLQTPPTFLPLGAALSALSFPSPGSPQGAAVEAPTRPGAWAGLPGQLRGPRHWSVLPTIRLVRWLFLFSRGFSSIVFTQTLVGSSPGGACSACWP